MLVWDLRSFKDLRHHRLMLVWNLRAFQDLWRGSGCFFQDLRTCQELDMKSWPMQSQLLVPKQFFSYHKLGE